jgi:hypothetical protein
MDTITKRVASHPTSSFTKCSVVLPGDVWFAIFELSAHKAEIHLTPNNAFPNSMMPSIRVKAILVNVAAALLTLCKLSREAIFQQLVLYIDLPNVTEARLALPATVLQSVRYIRRTLTISPTSVYTQTYKSLDLAPFAGLKRFDVVVQMQLRRNRNQPLSSNLSPEEMREEVDYINMVGLAGGHFTFRPQEATNAIDYGWAKYWKSPQLGDATKSMEENMRGLSLGFGNEVKINVNYEITYLIRQGPGRLASLTPPAGSLWIRRIIGPVAEEKAVVVTWSTTFPNHEISGKKVTGI